MRSEEAVFKDPCGRFSCFGAKKRSKWKVFKDPKIQSGSKARFPKIQVEGFHVLARSEDPSGRFSKIQVEGFQDPSGRFSCFGAKRRSKDPSLPPKISPSTIHIMIMPSPLVGVLTTDYPYGDNPSQWNAIPILSQCRYSP